MVDCLYIYTIYIYTHILYPNFDDLNLWHDVLFSWTGVLYAMIKSMGIWGIAGIATRHGEGRVQKSLDGFCKPKLSGFKKHTSSV